MSSMYTDNPCGKDLLYHKSHDNIEIKNYD